MPYIKKELRSKYSDIMYEISNIDISSKGELEYLLFSILKEYMNRRRFCYHDLHDATYACQHVADEFRRRFLDVRENEAMNENGYI
jgi:hypothetical protein